MVRFESSGDGVGTAVVRLRRAAMEIMVEVTKVFMLMLIAVPFD